MDPTVFLWILLAASIATAVWKRRHPFRDDGKPRTVAQTITHTAYPLDGGPSGGSGDREPRNPLDPAPSLSAEVELTE